MVVPLHPHQPYLTPWCRWSISVTKAKQSRLRWWTAALAVVAMTLVNIAFIEYTGCIGLMGFLLVDMSPATFESLAELSVGVIEIEWYFITKK